ncbi:hypothetical protein CFC21_064036 [Triticum aestivum]|uniref:RING-type E3 ubiquitin transferase n=2 Tax=Triticum aestivum TaxID=4565 RepID=A0A3B6KBU7_WHEAT|nr:hypothetical protein CFC21_064036 [Triticum aestivum]
MSNSTVLLIGASVAVLAVLSVFTFVCSNRRRVNRASRSPSLPRVDVGVEQGGDRSAATAGIDEAALAAFPTMVYSRATTGEDGTTCAVCLADYADGDELRRLPGCRHVFHQRCVDDWLRQRTSCPLCRAAPPTTGAG